MQTQHSLGQLSKVVVLALLALGLLVMGWSAALAQGPVEVQATAEPDESGVVIDPPSAADLGQTSTNDRPQDDVKDQAGGPIDIFDLSFVAGRYGSNDPAADLNLDGQVDIFDLTILASHYGQTKPEAGAAAIPTPAPLPVVEANSKFGGFDLAVKGQKADTAAQYIRSRTLRVGVSVNYVKIYDTMDGQTNTPPDPYAVVSVGGVPVRTATVYDRYEAWPYWRLGWWRYDYFPWASSYSTEANAYSLPIGLEMRDDDGVVCYGYYGCRPRFEYVDISPVSQRWIKGLTFYPSSCMVVDEAGTRTYGAWLDANRCRVYLQSWGTEWGRGYVSYYVDALWE
jgi:hypothetical protein